MPTLHNDASCGVIYIATGKKCVSEALESVRSLKASNPGLSATLFTDLDQELPDFDRVHLIENPSHTSFDKVVNISRSPYDKTLYLDSDTYITDDITDVFILLDQFDFAGVIEIARGYWYRQHTDLPDSFPEINTGVFAFRKCQAVDQLFTDWSRFYKESIPWQKTPGLTRRIWDQPGLRRALYKSTDLRISSLPSEYNALQFTGTSVWGKAKILHGRHCPKEFAVSINRRPGQYRVYLQQIGTYAGWANMSVGELLSFALRVNAVVLMGILKKITPNRTKAATGKTEQKTRLSTGSQPIPAVPHKLNKIS